MSELGGWIVRAIFELIGEAVLYIVLGLLKWIIETAFRPVSYSVKRLMGQDSDTTQNSSVAKIDTDLPAKSKLADDGNTYIDDVEWHKWLDRVSGTSKK